MRRPTALFKLGAKALCLAPLALLSLACTPRQPPRWAEGGAPLVIAPARWERSEDADDTIEIRADGQVVQDGDLVMVIDRVGRVTDEDYEPIAVLLPDGHVAGNDDTLLGRIGVSNASPPDSAAAWLAVLPNGQVVFFDEDGERANGGVWYGCQGPQQRACTLVTHMIALRNYRQRSRGGVSVGVGIGIGF